jgi:hypothetical protein
MSKQHPSSDTRRPIEPQCLYPLELAKHYLGWGAASLRHARRNGLRVKYAGGRGYVLGQDIIQYILSSGKDSK